MRILILTQWFDPEPTPKGLSFAKALAERGHQVQVLTGFPNYPEGRLYPGYRLRLYQWESMDGIRVLRAALFPSRDRSAVKRAINYATFAAAAALLGTLLIKQVDLIYVYHPPATVGLAAHMLGMRLKAPFVYDIQDLWPDTLGATGMLGAPAALKVIRAMCRFVYGRCGRIVVLSPGFKRMLIKRGVTAAKIDVVYNWCEEAHIKPVPRDDKLARALGLAGRFNVVFAGNMGPAQALTAVLAAAALVKDQAPEIQFVFVGSGMALDDLKKATLAAGLENVRFLPRRPMREISKLLNMADALLVHLKNDPLFEITIPSKTQAYMAVGRPILMGVRGDAADLVHKAGAGLQFEPESGRGLAQALLQLYSMPQAQRDRMGANGRAFYSRKMARVIGVGRLERIFHQCVQESRGR